jgi:hypothetical protein
VAGYSAPIPSAAVFALVTGFESGRFGPNIPLFCWFIPALAVTRFAAAAVFCAFGSNQLEQRGCEGPSDPSFKTLSQIWIVHMTGREDYFPGLKLRP